MASELTGATTGGPFFGKKFVARHRALLEKHCAFGPKGKLIRIAPDISRQKKASAMHCRIRAS